VLAEIVGSAVEAAKPLLEEAGHTLTLVFTSADPVVLDADFTRLAQVFGNLLEQQHQVHTPWRQYSFRGRTAKRRGCHHRPGYGYWHPGGFLAQNL
jgi:hypothetical protein